MNAHSYTYGSTRTSRLKLPIGHILRFATLCLVAASILLPSGSIYGFNVKVTLAILVGSIFIVDLFRTKRIRRQEVTFLVWFACFLSFYSLIAAVRNTPLSSTATEITAFLATILLVFFPLHLAQKGYIRWNRLLSFTVHVVFIYSLTKLLAEFLIIFHVITIDALLHYSISIFDYPFVRSDTGILTRINLPSDFLIPGFIVAVLCHKALGLKIPQPRLGLYLTVALFALAIAYSRYLWFFGFVAIVVGLFGPLTIWQPHKKLISRRSIAALLVILAILAIYLTLSDLGAFDFVGQRYLGQQAESSDYVRQLMRPELLATFYKHPLLGSGLGAFAPNLIRFPNIPWNYELQWLAFAMQFGILGLIIIFLFLLAIFRQLLSRRTLSLGFALLFSIWLATGFFNCFLLTSSAGVAYLQYIVMGMIAKSPQSTSELTSSSTPVSASG